MMELQCCNNELVNTRDPVAMQQLWEEGSPSIGAWLSKWAHYVTRSDGPKNNWTDHISTVVDPNIGNEMGGCGVIGAQCNRNIDCEDRAFHGYGGHYWAVQALVGFHDRLNVAHEYLRDSVGRDTKDHYLSLRHRSRAPADLG